MNDKDLIQRALRLAVMAIYWAKDSVRVAINTGHQSLRPLSRKMDETVKEARELVKAAHARKHLSDTDRDRWLALIDDAATFGSSRGKAT